VIQTGTIRKLEYGFLFTFNSNWFMVLSCIISEIKLDIAGKSFDAAVRGVPIGSDIPFCVKKTRMVKTHNINDQKIG